MWPVVYPFSKDNDIPWITASPGADLDGPMQGAALVAAPLDERPRTLR